MTDINGASEIGQGLGSMGRQIASFENERVKMRQDTSLKLIEIERKSLKEFNKINDEMNKLGKISADGIGKNLGEALNGFANKTKGAREAFSDFARSFVNDILNMTARMAAFNALQGAAGFGGAFAAYADGGIMPGHFTPMATGGVFSRPTMGLVAEGKNAEAVVPLPDNRSIPVQFKGAQEQRPITVVNVLDQGMIESVVSDTIAKKSQVIVNMIGSDIRGGGVTYQSIKGMR